MSILDYSQDSPGNGGNFVYMAAQTNPQNLTYLGLMVFKQGSYYGVLNPITATSVGHDDTINMQWWIGDEGITDFSNLPTIQSSDT